MDLETLIEKLEAMGFSPKGRGAYVGTTRFSHHAVLGGSVFIGDGESVYYPTADHATRLNGDGAFLIANGRDTGMTAELGPLGCEPTGSIKDPDGRTSPDDPYWRGEGLDQLLEAMKRRFRR